ncbi:novel immune-type receptor 14b isoform X2 [Puntigrus tetrazona]|uniref:novel immune-type receptor 14b isoform X2 n=1 Tax=Puntigrus tetrazona TaxID=1606681 RepID=UPI001C89436E|nr:novel immune-type receptor 14b isoform X2 [Puntigrus tetrazona]
MIAWTFLTVLCLLLFAGTARPPVHQPDQVRTVALGNAVTLQCFSDKDNIFWYKQIAGRRPQVISALQKKSDPRFFNEFKNHRFSANRLGTTSNLTISDVVRSDQAVYYCGTKAFYIEFGSGTRLIVQDLASNTSESDRLSDLTECHHKRFENSTHQVKDDISEESLRPAVLGLACALGLCGVLIFALVGFILKMQGSGNDNHVKGVQVRG